MDDTQHDWTPNDRFYVLRFALDSSSPSNKRFFGNLFARAFVLRIWGLPSGSWQEKVELVASLGELGDERPCGILLNQLDEWYYTCLHRFYNDELYELSSPRPPTPC